MLAWTGIGYCELAVRCRNSLGSVVVVRPVRGGAVDGLRERLHGTCPVLVLDEIYESTDLWDALVRGRTLFIAGEPMLSRYYVVELLLMRKLDNEDAWVGKDKGYEYFDELANGRGVDIKHRGIMPLIVNYLFTFGLLIKKPSRNRPKYALNPDRPTEIYRIMETRALPERLQDLLMRDGDLESARLLDPPTKPRIMIIMPPGYRGILRINVADQGVNLNWSAPEIRLTFPDNGVLALSGKNPTLGEHDLTGRYSNQLNDPLPIAGGINNIPPDHVGIWFVGPCAIEDAISSSTEFFVGTPQEAAAAGL